MSGTRRVSILVAVAMLGGMVSAAIPALPAAGLVATNVTEDLIAGASSPFGLAVVSVDNQHIYWGNAGTDTIGRANLTGTSPDENFINARINTNGQQEATNGVAVYGNHLYWSNQFTGTIGRATLNGNGAATDLQKTFITGGNQTTRVVVTGDHIYWSNNGNGTIGRADLDANGDLVSLASINQAFIATGSGPVGLAVDGTHIYWANQNDNTIGRAELGGTNVTNSFITSGVVTPAGVAVDSTHIYWANYSTNTLSSATLNGNGAASDINPTLITGANSPRGVAVDSNNLYWANNGNGTIGRATLLDVPGAPTIGTATGGIGTGSVSFTPPADNGGTAVTGYTATCTSSNGGVMQQASAGGSPILVSGLSNGFLYTCSVTATNAIGTGAPSGPSNSFVVGSVPGAPTIGTATAGNGTGSVTFTPPSSNGGLSITGYTMTCTSSNGGVMQQASGSVSPILVSGLSNSFTYTCSVTATNGIGTGVPSGPSNTFVPATVPDAPTIGTAMAGNGTGSVTFMPPTSNGGTAVTGYTVTCTSSNGGVTQQASGSVSPILVSGLSNGSTYTCTVTATNAAGTSGPSAPSNPFVPAAVPGAPTINAVTVIVDPETQTATSVGVSFTPGPANGSPITSYTVTCVSLAGGPTGTATGTGSPIIVTGLSGGQYLAPYQCTVTATNAAGTSLPSAPSSIFFVGRSGPGNCTTIPTAPGSPSTAPGDGSATVSWAPSSGCVAGYVVTPYLGSVPQPSILVPGIGTTTVFPGLTNGVSYRFTIAAENGSTLGPASAFTATVAPGAPLATRVLGVTRVARGALKVSFATPANNGAPIKSYTATCTSSNRGATRAKTAKKGPVTVTGLTPGKTYHCTVKATNSRGTGPASKASKAATA